jgi:hypothetical protein
MSVDEKLGSDVSILCMRCATFDHLARIDEAGFLQDLESWWKEASHPSALADTARKICQDFPKMGLSGVRQIASKKTFPAHHSRKSLL